MTKRPNLLPQTASQTAGPYVHIGLAPDRAGFEIYKDQSAGAIAPPDVIGERIRIQGVIHDGAGDQVLDGLLEVWQADAGGHFAGDPACAAGFTGWTRTATDFDTGLWMVDTIRPGAVTDAQGRLHAPHIALWIVARGINIGLATRIYFDGEALNETDPLLATLGPRRNTLIATQAEDGAYRFDIHLQGDGETVFLDI